MASSDAALHSNFLGYSFSSFTLVSSSLKSSICFSNDATKLWATVFEATKLSVNSFVVTISYYFSVLPKQILSNQTHYISNCLLSCINYTIFPINTQFPTHKSVQKFHPQNLVTRLTPLNIFYFISFLPSAFAPEYPFCQKVWVLPKCTNTLAKPIINHILNSHGVTPSPLPR